MRAPSPRAAGLSALLAAAAAVGVIALGGGHDAAPQPAGELVPVERGDVSVTVGGIGHVTTLAGAARLAGGSGGAGGSGSGGSSASGPSATGTSSAAAAGAARDAPADAVFPAVAGHVTQLLVRPGDTVLAGQPVARLADDGTLAGALLQARSDLSTARLELAQKRVQDPARGVPPTPAELAAAQQGIVASRAKLRTVLAGPLPADVATARSELARADADLVAARAGGPAAVAAAEIAVEAAQQKLATVTAAPDPAEVAAAKLEVAKAMVDQQTLLAPPDPATPPPSDAAKAAAQLAVDAAQAKLDAVLHPPAPVVTAARQELAKASADLATQRATSGPAGTAAADAAVRAARRRLRQLTAGPAPDAVPSARSDLRKAQADLAVLRQRGAPASAVDLALARLKVDVAAQRLGLERHLQSLLLVRANTTGTVTSVLTTQGASADPTTPIVRVQDLDHLVVTLDLSEFDVGRTRVGAPALVRVDALGGREFGGRVSDIALSGTDAGGVVNFPLTIALRAHRSLRPGMSVRARVIVRGARDVVRVPVAAVHEGDRPSVIVRGAGRALVERPVRLGLTGGTYVEVRSGLRAGERVLVPSGAGA